MEQRIPKYLYKIISMENWQASKGQKFVRLSAEDGSFIHLSQEDQLDRIVEKYWGKISQFAILKIETDILPGRMAFEANPGGKNKYYHLYNGSIPLEAVVEARVVDR